MSSVTSETPSSNERSNKNKDSNSYDDDGRSYSSSIRLIEEIDEDETQPQQLHSNVDDVDDVDNDDDDTDGVAQTNEEDNNTTTTNPTVLHDAKPLATTTIVVDVVSDVSAVATAVEHEEPVVVGGKPTAAVEGVDDEKATDTLVPLSEVPTDTVAVATTTPAATVDDTDNGDEPTRNTSSVEDHNPLLPQPHDSHNYDDDDNNPATATTTYIENDELNDIDVVDDIDDIVVTDDVPLLEQQQQPPPFVNGVINNNNDELILDHLPPDLVDDIVQQQQQQQRQPQDRHHRSKYSYQYLLTYRPLSFLLAIVLLWYALRTRHQYYFTMTYLSHSKVAYVIFGNTIVATAIVIFDIMIYLFFRTTTTTTTNINNNNQNNNSDPNQAPPTTTTTTTTLLRIQEAEGLQDFFRWNVTETCLALTMFRYELTVVIAIQFVFIILLKCLHYVASQREQHLRMTEDVIAMISTSHNNSNNTHTAMDIHDHPDDNDDNDETSSTKSRLKVAVSYMRSFILFARSSHTSIILFYMLLQMIDMYIIQQCLYQILQTGHASVKILFAFEAAILLVSTYSHVVLYGLHFIDCCIQYGNDTIENALAKRLVHPWKEYKATFIFAIELQSQVLNFLFYCTFFCIVLTFYGLPINLFREVYISFMKLKERLIAFFHYRQLMASMNRFRTATEEELNQSGRICIICRDEMSSGHDCKRLPICGHTFHKSCLREWLVQQQSCPTCRADIAAMEALEASRTAAANAATQRTITPPTAATTTTTVEATQVVTTADETNAKNDTDASTLASSSAVGAAAATTTNTGVDAIDPSQEVVTSSLMTPLTTTETATKNSIVSFSSTSLVIPSNTNDSSNIVPGVIQPINPTLYEVVGISATNDDAATADDIPIYTHDSIITLTTNSQSSFRINETTLAPIRSIGKHTLILGMAKYQKQFAHDECRSYIQLPDQTWIQNDHLRSICVVQHYAEKTKNTKIN